MPDMKKVRAAGMRLARIAEELAEIEDTYPEDIPAAAMKRWRGLVRKSTPDLQLLAREFGDDLWESPWGALYGVVRRGFMNQGCWGELGGEHMRRVIRELGLERR